MGSYGKSQHFTKIHIDKKLPKGLIVNCEIYKIKENISKNPNKMAEALAKHSQLIKKLDPEYYQLLKSL